MPPPKKNGPKRNAGPPLRAPANAAPRPPSGGGGRRPPAKKPRRRMHWFKRLLIKAALAVAVLLVLAYCWFSYNLPNINDLNTLTKAPSVLIKSEDGQVVGSFGDIYGSYIPFDDLPTSLTDAVVATEDRNFYHHHGIDPFGLLRALFVDLRARHMVQGGSTITQQVAKNIFLTNERTFGRKIREMLLALKLEKRYSKQQIISIYLNRVYFGSGSYGIDAAAHRYFDKSARDMSLSESAIMAGLLKAPSRFAPTSNPLLSRKRAEQVLVNMEDAGYLSKAQSDKARVDLTKMMNKRKASAQSSLYFADWIMDELPDYLGNVQEDLVVTTTLKPDWQLLAEKAVNTVMDKEGSAHDAEQAALVAMSPDGAIRAMIGGRSYAESQYNRATQALRQPGSSFKLFVYLAGLEQGLTPDSIVEDAPITVGHWQPKNYSGHYEGAIPLRDAVAQSINTVAVRVAQQVGVWRVINVAKRLGITSELDPVPSIALGSTEVSLLELTGAYAHLPAEGTMVDPYGIVDIKTAQGKTLYHRYPEQDGVVLRADVVSMMNELLTGVITNPRGTGRAANIGRPMAGKTGTTSDYKDAWFIGYTGNLVTGVWVGNDDNSPMKKVTGGMLPAAIWHGFMSAALSGVPVKSLPAGGGEPAHLPWQNGSYPSQPEKARDRDNGGAPLGRSFWDKLLR